MVDWMRFESLSKMKGFRGPSPSRPCETGGTWMPHPAWPASQSSFRHQHSQAVHGHSGIVNTIKHVQAVTGIDKIHAVVGGIHLAAAPDALVAKTAEAFQQIQPDYFVPMHCTGFYPALNEVCGIQRTVCRGEPAHARAPQGGACATLARRS